MTQGNYGQRAAGALDAVLPPRGRIKTVQRLFDVSDRMARYLLAGDRWTARRLMQASELLGDAWDAAFSQPDTAFRRHLADLDRDARFMRLEQHVEQMDRQIKTALAHQQVEQTPVEIRGSGQDTKDDS